MSKHRALRRCSCGFIAAVMRSTSRYVVHVSLQLCLCLPPCPASPGRHSSSITSNGKSYRYRHCKIMSSSRCLLNGIKTLHDCLSFLTSPVESPKESIELLLFHTTQECSCLSSLLSPSPLLRSPHPLVATALPPPPAMCAARVSPLPATPPPLPS